MSWFFLIALILLASFACAYGACEWFVRRGRGGGPGDGSPTG